MTKYIETAYMIWSTLYSARGWCILTIMSNLEANGEITRWVVPWIPIFNFQCAENTHTFTKVTKYSLQHAEFKVEKQKGRIPYTDTLKKSYHAEGTTVIMLYYVCQWLLCLIKQNGSSYHSFIQYYCFSFNTLFRLSQVCVR